VSGRDGKPGAAYGQNRPLAIRGRLFRRQPEQPTATQVAQCSSLDCTPVLRRTKLVSKNTICLWYDGTALEAAQFYAETFPDSAVGAIHRAPGDYPAGKQGDVLTVGFTVIGIPCLGLNGGPAFRHNEAFSFQVATDDQAETDRLWNAIVRNGGQESACGWCKDKWGLSWQITPRALMDAIADPDRAAAKRAFEAMMQMRKIDIAAIDAARRG
jgi:2-polyprenyl-6-hydroxyphenyl methylase/3-demethylubiquinone-9 3-methyltransferase